MQPKSPQAKTYSFHFNRLTPTNTPNTLPFHKEHFNATHTPKSTSINFRYQQQGQQIQTNSFSINDYKKPSLNKEKSSEPIKKYTFSLLVTQGQQIKLNQSHEEQNGKLPQNSNKQVSLECQKGKLPFQQKYNFKHATKTNSNVQSVEKNYSLELIRQREAKLTVQNQLRNKNSENSALKIQIAELQNIISLKDSQLQQLTTHIEQLKKKNKENQLIYCQNSAKGKNADSTMSSKTLTSQVEENQQQLEKQVKEWSNSTIIYNYEEEYKQILAIFEVQLSEENCHDHLLVQIDTLLKRVEQANRSIALTRQRQKENCRLTHHIKRLQADNIHLVNLIPLLNKQIERTTLMLQQANREIQVVNLARLNIKYLQREYLNEKK